MRWTWQLFVSLWLGLLLAAVNGGEHLRNFEISEGAPIGTRVGFIGERSDGSFSGSSSDSGPGPPYLIVPVPGSFVDSDISIEPNTGEIRTKVALDRETRAAYSLVAIPSNGQDNIRVVVRVLDENDNAPTFPSPVMSIEFPENTPRDVKRTLHPARDLDLGIFNTQRYNIVSGNVNNAFRLSSHRERDGVLYLDLQINGFLDRETTAGYSLVIEALDGGSPPLRGCMVVNITIQDVNDNQPIFNQSRYSATVPENATIGTSILQVFATDIDAGENGQVEYLINRRQSDRDGLFRIDPNTGQISVDKQLDFETKEIHELVVVAKDRGVQPLETTAFVTIKVTDVNDNQPTINVIFLSDDATPKISEMAQAGEFVARISVNDPDSKAEYANVNVTLEGGEGHFGLAKQNDIIYLVIVKLPIDREKQPNYTLSVIAKDTGSPPLHASRTFHLRVTDVNDNAPEFDKQVYHVNVLEVAEPGTSVFQISAHDRDEGSNSEITYSIRESSESHSNWFQIDQRSGLITTKYHVDCETEPVPHLIVVATDNGSPPLSSSATVLVTIHDVNDNEPIFDHSFYNVTIPENEVEGHCILKVSATDPDCGINAMVNYTLGEGSSKTDQFEVKSMTGEICIAKPLDYEVRNTFEFSVIATDRGGLSTTAVVKIQLTDINDNLPVFYPRDYNVSVRENSLDPTMTTPTAIAVVVATDKDSGSAGNITYHIVSGNDKNLFRIDKYSGEIYLTTPNILAQSNLHVLNISAVDGGGLKSAENAKVFVSVVNSQQSLPVFERSRYNFNIPEDALKNTVVGTVKASSSVDSTRQPYSLTNYSIYSGDPDDYFSIEPNSGIIRTAALLDHEARANVLLNVQAVTGSPAVFAHTQVNIVVEDKNDNAPNFDSNTVRISVPENMAVGSPLYAALANDRDSGSNGVVRYQLISSASVDSRLFTIDSASGHVTLTRSLDYETAQRHTLLISATDSGEPPLSTNLTVLLEVQDVNDNPPVFERSEYSVPVAESVESGSQIIQVTAVDLDTGNNARLTYKLVVANDEESKQSQVLFGVHANTGWLYLKKQLDRETKDRYLLKVTASDNGTPALTATAKIIITVTDTNDNEPVFTESDYKFSIEENLSRGAFVGVVKATDKDLDSNAAIRYSLILSNSSFLINPFTGEISTRESLDREMKSVYEVVVEARDQGSPPRSARVVVQITVTDVNDNTPELLDPQEDVISVREEQPPGTEVVRIRAVDKDDGNNATITYAILKNRDSDGHGVFSIDSQSGVVRTKIVLDHEEKTVYRLAVSASDNGSPPKQTIRLLRVEVLDLADNRPTFTSSSLSFKVREDAPIGFIVGNIVTSDASGGAVGGHVMYSLSSLSPTTSQEIFDMDRSSGCLVVSRQLDRETHSEYRLEVRALDTSTSTNPQSSAVTVRVEVTDVNDNAPYWDVNPVSITIFEDAPVGYAIWNFTARDKDLGSNSDLRYKLVQQFPETEPKFFLDPLTGTLTLTSPLDYELISSYILVIEATDQAVNVSERLTTSLTARIMVQDANDNAPTFISPVSETIYISDFMDSKSVLLKAIAIDKDSANNGHVSYSISGDNEDDIFTIGFDSGLLTLKKSFDVSHKSAGKFKLNITASDHGSPHQHHTSMTVNIILKPTSGIPPKFIAPVYPVNVPEDSPVGHFIVKVTARYAALETNESGNLSYSIPAGVADDCFAVDPVRGNVVVQKMLDREYKDHYVVTVYVTDSSTLQYDVTSVEITVTDVNDHAPFFKPGSCYPLNLPENCDLSIIHTVVASDLDSGSNGEVTYSISGGNLGNKFSIDLHSGQLTARPLDREMQARYHLVITAQDKGMTSLHGICNITIYVEDQNDNDPKFVESSYKANISENTPIGSTVFTVKATDADIGMNSKIVYSLTNESHWLFRIDNKTGTITTTGLFDREKQSVFNFQVVATDSGRYDVRSQKVPVQIIIEDVNDNKPLFSQYPFFVDISTYIQPGHEFTKVFAEDKDEGTNAEIVYRFQSETINNKFHINPNTGAISAASSFSNENGKIFHLEVVATDKGNPPLSSVGLVEIKVGEMPEGTPFIRFQNSSYVAHIPENSPSGKDVLQVSAFRSDSRRQRIVYRIQGGNENNVFEMDSNTGLIRINNSHLLDYEVKSELHLVVVAQTDNNGSPLYGYTNVTIYVLDQNDNTPHFTQQHYLATVWEGNNKGTFVIQVSAIDIDGGSNSRITYHIVDGNHDNAFVIEPSLSGMVKTNIVLDREIRDSYKLTVIATDEGMPQLTGSATIQISIVDVNDNLPTFPPHSVITVREGMEVGSVLTAVTANDVDTNPALTYAFTGDVDPESAAMFSIDRFSGRIALSKSLDFETRQEYILGINASDTAHFAQTVLTIHVTDDNDHAPVFAQPFYIVTFSEESSHSTVVSVIATDEDSGSNGAVRYSFSAPVAGFYIDDHSGTISVNRSLLVNSSHLQTGIIDLVVVAADGGNPSKSSTVPVRVYIASMGHNSLSKFIQQEFRVSIREKVSRGTTILKMLSTTTVDEFAQFSIIAGNENNVFQILSPIGELVLVKDIDRETQDIYSLVIASAQNSSSALVDISIEDSNDNAPQFQSLPLSVSVSEGAPIGYSIIQIFASDADLPPNSDISYDIISGNDEDLFTLDRNSGVLSVKNYLDYDTGISEHTLVIRASDNAKLPAEIPLSTITTLKILLEDENDNSPKFPVTEYLEFVAENEPVGTAVFTARATDADRGIFGKLNYSILSAAATGFTDLEDSWKLFKVDSSTGLVTTTAVFDYETRSRYAFTLHCSDSGGRFTKIRIRVEIESRDEFHPQFTERTFKFILGRSDYFPVGYTIGHVTATDRDKGPDGRVVYQLTTQHPYFKINRTTGAMIVKKKLDSGLEWNQDINLVVTASSGRQGSLTNTSIVEISFDPISNPGTNLASNSNGNTVSVSSSGVADWAMGLLIALILIILGLGALFLFLHVRNRRHKKINKPGLNSGQSTDNFVDASSFDTIPIRGGAVAGPGPGPASQFGPPKYDDIPTYRNNNSSSNSGAATTSELSGSEQSGSSGRGSAEDGEDVEDEEIRMINEGHRPVVEEDTISQASVQNTQEYLARLGIVEHRSATGSGTGRHTYNEPDLSTLLYPKLGSGRGSTTDEVDRNSTSNGSRGASVLFSEVPSGNQPSMTGSLSSIVHSEEELTGSYNWDYLLDWGPQYQPLAHVFSEIARLKDDTASIKSGVSGTSSGKKSFPPIKTLPPPLLTNVAPRSIAAPILSARTPHLFPQIPRSPISHDPANFSSAAMSPSFSPSLSPLATRSPSISPLHPSSHHRQTTETELRI